MLTLMGIFAQRHEIDLTGTRLSVIKEMVKEPVRRIGRLTVAIDMPKGISARHREGLKQAALTCPVHKSLHPDIEIPVTFHYPD